MVDEQDAVQVIQFVLEADGVETLDLFLDLLAGIVEVADADAGRR